MDLDKKLKVWKLIGGASAAALLLSATCMFSNTHKASKELDKYQTLDSMLKSAGVHQSEGYNDYYTEIAKDLHQKLYSGEITTDEFKKEYDKLLAGDYLATYARESTDLKIKSIVEDYDKEYHEYQEKEMKEFNNSLVSGCGMVGALALVAGAYNTVNNLKNEKPRKEIHEYLL